MTVISVSSGTQAHKSSAKGYNHYGCEHTVQFVAVGSTFSSLHMHEDDGNGHPLCGTTPRSMFFQGQPMEWIQQGGGVVTCHRCWQVRQAREYPTTIW